MANQAFAHAALEAGVRVVAGYPGTPSSEVIETIATLHASGAAHGVHVEWSTNEKAALELCAGASYAGARTLFTCKQMGLNVASDPLLCVNYVGVRGGMVLFVADDPGPISSQTEQDTRRFAAFAKVPVFDPATPEQGFLMMKEAFELSERYHTPVIVRPTTRICHASTFFEVAEHTEARAVPNEGFVRDSKWVIFPARSLAAHHDINKRLPEIATEFSRGTYAREFNPVFSGGVCGGNWSGGTHGNSENACDYKTACSCEGTPRETCDADACSNNASPATFGIVAGGVSAAYAREALHIVEERACEQNIAVPAYTFMQIGTPFPFPAHAVHKFCQGKSDILVLEELDGVLEDELLRLAGVSHASFCVHGRLTGEVRCAGENDVDDIATRIARFLGIPHCAPEQPALRYDQAEHASEHPLPVRPPVLCAGCPHRASFYAVKRALGKTPAVFCGDIGCYTLGNAQPLDAVDTCLCMGAGITIAQGLEIADPCAGSSAGANAASGASENAASANAAATATGTEKKILAFIGDSTFFASGMTGVANAVYNRHNITIVVLDNATTAMTGAQPHPGTGQTLMGQKSTPLSIASVLQALGVTCVETANPLNLDESIAAAKKALSFQGPSAIIFEEPCVQLKKPRPAVGVDVHTCTGCKKCITEIGCPGISFNAGAAGEKSGTRGQAYVNTSLCNGCGLCMQVCPSGAISAPTSAAHASTETTAPCTMPATDVSAAMRKPSADALFTANASTEDHHD